MSKENPLRPQQDRDIGTTVAVIGGRRVTAYNEKLAFDILDQIAEGKTLNDICTIENGMPHRRTFRRWVVLHPPLAKAYREALLISASSLEEEALDIARTIRKNPGTSTDIRAAEVALNQFRWSATRRDPAKYGERGLINIAVPIQINTGLNLGEGAKANSETSSVYDIKASVPQEIVIEEDEIKLITSKSKRYGPRKRVLTPRVPKEVKK